MVDDPASGVDDVLHQGGERGVELVDEVEREQQPEHAHVSRVAVPLRVAQ